MTSQPPTPAEQPAEPSQKSGSTLYSDSSEALKAVRDDFHYWTGKLTDSSFDLSLAVIAANWAVFGTVSEVLKNSWSRASIVIVLIGLGINLVGAKTMGEWHRERLEYAEADPELWRKEFDQTHGSTDPWPFTQRIEWLGRVLRECKTYVPLVGGIMFLIALASP